MVKEPPALLRAPRRQALLAGLTAAAALAGSVALTPQANAADQPDANTPSKTFFVASFMPNIKAKVEEIAGDWASPTPGVGAELNWNEVHVWDLRYYFLRGGKGEVHYSLNDPKTGAAKGRVDIVMATNEINSGSAICVVQDQPSIACNTFPGPSSTVCVVLFGWVPGVQPQSGIFVRPPVTGKLCAV